MASDSDNNGSTVDLSKIMAWYTSHCDGEWEHQQGVSIQTLDNPGWLLKVNLIGTNLENATMMPISEDCDELSNPEAGGWIDCRIKEQEFVGASDPTQLPRLINTLSALIDAHPR